MIRPDVAVAVLALVWAATQIPACLRDYREYFRKDADQ